MRRFVNPKALALYTIAALLFVQVSALADYKRINLPNPDDTLNAHIFELDNGLRVYLTENHETPRFYAEIAIRAGSKHDPANATGLAHYLEHLLFKGNQSLGTLDYSKERIHLDYITELYENHVTETDPEKRAAIYAEINRVAQLAAEYAIPNEIDKLYNAMGGTHVNAHTSNEETIYKVGLPANRMEQWAAIESKRYHNPVFRLFHTELETVYEEKNRSLDNQSRVVMYEMMSKLYKKHPYGQQPTIGTVEHLKNPSLNTIYNFFNTYYVPNNMAIFISGDINIAETMSIIDENFGFWEPEELPKVGPWREKRISGVERSTVKYQGNERLEIAFRTVPYHHRDFEALMLFDMILDNSQAGLININLSQAQRVRGAGSFPRSMNDYGSQHLFGVPKEGQTLEEVEKLLLDQIDLIKNGEFEDWIIPAIITDFKQGQKAGLESNLSRVGAMTAAFLTFEDWDSSVASLDRMAQVDKDDVVRVANKYFGRDYIAVARLDEQHEVPPVQKPKIDPVNIDPTRQSQFARDLLDMPYNEIEPTYVDMENDFTVIEYAGGVDLYYSQNPLNDLFSFSIQIELGSYEDKTLSMASSLLDKSGTADFSSDDIKKEWYKLGSNFRFGAGSNSTSFSISGLDENFEATLELALKLATDPRVDAETLETLKAIVLKSREDAKKSPGAIGQALSTYNRFQSESTFLRMLSSEEINALSVDELLASVKNLLGYKQTLIYTGSLPVDEVVKIVRKHHPLSDTLKDTPPYRFQYTRDYDETEIYFFDKEMAQAMVRIEFADGNFDPKERINVSIYNSYFGGGMSGIVFQELREARALAYSAQALYRSGTRLNAENIAVGVIGCQADKTVEAVEAFLGLFDNLPETPERFNEATTSIANIYRTSKLGFRSVVGAVRNWERMGFDTDPRKESFEMVQAAQISDLMNFHANHIKGKPKLISIVGDKNKIDMDALAKFGTITEIAIDDIFVK
jgi:predicted Zn-dependent peptidase